MTPTPDYSTYSQDDLLRRVTDLEAQLRRLNASHTPPTSYPTPLKKPKKAPKPFDPSRYNTRYIALKFAYLGGNYNGFEHHANNTTPLPTIEEQLWRALRKTKLIFPADVKLGKDSSEEVNWDGCEYSKCGRTDRGVSAFGQVIGLRVRSSRPKAKAVSNGMNGTTAYDSGDGSMPDAVAGAVEVSDTDGESNDAQVEPAWDSTRDELPYIQLLNRVLPTDIRILAWCPNPGPDFSARFSCKERRYRYFFTNPAYVSGPSSDEGLLDIDKMNEAARKFEGVHDFRNFCKIDPSKQITNFERRIFSASIQPARREKNVEVNGVSSAGVGVVEPEMYYFEVRGSAFLWHQVRHLVAILFHVGQGYEEPSIADTLLDIERTPSRPIYEMADDRPLVLWDCVFPSQEQITEADANLDRLAEHHGFVDALNWVYVGDKAGGRDPAKTAVRAVDDGFWGRNGIMDELWSQWRKRKMDEVLAGSLMSVIAERGMSRAGADAELQNGDALEVGTDSVLGRSDRVFDGSDRPRTVGKYVPVMQRERMEPPEVVNARYAARKGINGTRGGSPAGGGGEVDMND